MVKNNESGLRAGFVHADSDGLPPAVPEQVTPAPTEAERSAREAAEVAAAEPIAEAKTEEEAAPDTTMHGVSGRKIGVRVSRVSRRSAAKKEAEAADTVEKTRPSPTTEATVDAPAPARITEAPTVPETRPTKTAEVAVAKPSFPAAEQAAPAQPVKPPTVTPAPTVITAAKPVAEPPKAAQKPATVTPASIPATPAVPQVLPVVEPAVTAPTKPSTTPATPVPDKSERVTAQIPPAPAVRPTKQAPAPRPAQQPRPPVTPQAQSPYPATPPPVAPSRPTRPPRSSRPSTITPSIPSALPQAGPATPSAAQSSLAATAARFAAMHARREERKSETQTEARPRDRGQAAPLGQRRSSDRRSAPGAVDGYTQTRYIQDKDQDERPVFQSQRRRTRRTVQPGFGEALPTKNEGTRSGGFRSGGRVPGSEATTADGRRPQRGRDYRSRDRHAQQEDMYESLRNIRRDRRQSDGDAPGKAVLTSVTLPETMSVKDFAAAIKKTAAEVIKSLMMNGMMVTINTDIDFDTASIIAAEFNITAEQEVVVTEEDILFDEEEDSEEDLLPRPPVVVVMGHVDHGKTTLLDKIRDTRIASGEAGGITQHIGASMVKAHDRMITFLDTPGHEAFTTMRARGAQVTDVAILVVAADDGVMPQTLEAIRHAQAAGTDIVVAINKIDKPTANPDRVRQELAQKGLVPEDWGGETIMVPVSALTGENIDDLLEMVLLTADMKNLRANPDRRAAGTVIEARLDRSRGTVATLLVQRGTLRTGDTIVTGSLVGRVRAMVDHTGKQIDEAGPSVPVEIIGLPDVPEAGEIFNAVENERVAHSLAARRREEERERQLNASSRMSLDSLFDRMSAGEVVNLNIIIKADVQGSVEAVRQSLEKLSNEQVRINIIHEAVGIISETDIRLAEVSEAIIIGFNVRPDNLIRELAEEHGVDIRLYRVIYDAIEDIEKAMRGMLAPTYEEVVTARIEIREIFHASGVGTIGGGYVLSGKVNRNNKLRLIRDGIVIMEGRFASLRRFKDDVREVNAGYECGLSIENFNDIKQGDIVETYVMREVVNE